MGDELARGFQASLQTLKPRHLAFQLATLAAGVGRRRTHPVNPSGECLCAYKLPSLEFIQPIGKRAHPQWVAVTVKSLAGCLDADLSDESELQYPTAGVVAVCGLAAAFGIAMLILRHRERHK